MAAKPKYQQASGLEEGIYFGLEDDQYHWDPALSHSGMGDILDSPLDHWMNSNVLNPHKPQFKATPAMTFGKQCHKYLLEGQAFFKQYNVHGMSPNDKKQWLSKAEWAKIHDSIERIRMVPDGDDFFKNGIGEVSIIIRCPRTGIMLRVRIDYLRTFGAVDYKRIKELTDSAIGNAICAQKLDIQAWLYSNVIKLARARLRLGKLNVYGNVDPAWLKSFINSDRCEFRFFFQRSEPPFIWEIIDLDDDLLRKGEEWTFHAINKYKHYIETYGPNEWPAGTGKVRTFELFQTPRRIDDRKKD